MLKKIFYHFSLFILCLKLLLSIVFFSLELFFQKFIKKEKTPLVLGATITFLLAINTYLFTSKNTEKIIYQKTDGNELKKEFSVKKKLDVKEIEERIKYFQELEENQIKSRDLFLNLSLLYQEEDNKKLSQEYLERALIIDPNLELILLK